MHIKGEKMSWEISGRALAWAAAPASSSESSYPELVILIDFLSEYYAVLERVQPLKADLSRTPLAEELPETLKAGEIPPLNERDFQRKNF